jgi:diacylglycerol kinase (ATP)
MEEAFRQQVIVAVILIPIGFYIGSDGLEKALLVSACLIVLIVEVLNSASEAVVDRIGPELHELSGLAKDLGSASVLLSIFLFFMIWGLIIVFRRFLDLVRGCLW